MSSFEYRGYDASGRLRTGIVEGVDAKDARERLWRSGILAEEVHAVAELPASKRIVACSSMDRAAFYHELAALLKSGMPLARALQMLIEAAEAGWGRISLALIKDRLSEGAPFFRVLGDVIPNLPAFEEAVLEAAERTGTLADALEYLASFLDEQDRLKGRVINSLVYPSIVISAAVLIGGGTLGILVPRMGALLAQAQIRQPAITRLIIRVGQWIPWLLLGVAVAGLAVALWMRIRPVSREPLRSLWTRLLARCPWVSTLRDLLAALRFGRTLSLLLRGGVPLVEAVPLAGRATGRSDIAQASAEAAEKIRHGCSLAGAIRPIPPLASRLCGWIQAGESSGQLEALLESAVSRLQTQWESQMARRMAFLEPMLTLLVSVFVLLIALAVLLPILDMSRAL